MKKYLVSWVLWVPMFVFLFMYFVSRSPFILDLLCLVYYDGVSVCVCILLSCTFITFYFRSLVSCVLCVPLFVFVFLYFVSWPPFILDILCLGYYGFLKYTRHKRSKIKGDLDSKYKNINTNKGTHSTQDTRDLK
jgi:hypothetical protein